MNALLDAAARVHGLVIINHPALPSSEACRGCGWTAAGTDYAKVQGVEVVGGGLADGPLSGTDFWQARLNAGDHLTAVGGSENHSPDLPTAAFTAVGHPITLVRAVALSQRAVLSAIRAGHAFIDVERTPGRLVELTAGAARMGDTPGRAAGRGGVHPPTRVGVKDRWRVLEDGSPASTALADPIATDDQTAVFTLRTDGARHWVRLDVRTTDDRRAFRQE